MGDLSSHKTDTERLQQRNRELSILHTIAEALNHEVDLSQALKVALAHVAELFDLQTGWIFMLDHNTGKFYTAATQNLPPALNNPRRMGGTCHCLDEFLEGGLDAENIDVITCTRLKDLIRGTDGLRYHASIPLYAYGKPLGVLNVTGGDYRELSADDLELLATIGDLIGIAIQRARLFAVSAEHGAVEERNRLAREIHDTLAQGLTAISLQLESADVLLDAGSVERARSFVQQALLLTRANLEEARRSVLDLRAAPLEDRTLAEALEALLERTNDELGIKTHFDCVGASVPLPARVEAGVYRIAQEAITNALRHAEANSISIRLTVTAEKLELCIEDNGLGFDPSNLPAGHFGLIGLNERAKLLNGTLAIHSSPGEGTEIEVVIPVER